VGRPSTAGAAVALVAAAIFAAAATGIAGVAAIAASGAVAMAVTRLARAKIGGQTGDVLGAAQQLSYLAALLALAALLSP
jgi:adenosylcobinamide-GDP ribazoletransferase